MEILVLSARSNELRYEPVLDCADVDRHSLLDLLDKYSEYVTTAADMYTGDEHVAVMDAVGQLREFASVDWRILSAGFGLLCAETEIPAYECAFTFKNFETTRRRAERVGYDVEGMTYDALVKAVAAEKRIPNDFRQVIGGEYDLAFLLLGRPYLLSIADVLNDLPPDMVTYAYTSAENRSLLGESTWISATEAERQSLGTANERLRGEMFAAFACNVDGEQLAQARNDASLVQTLSSRPVEPT